MANEADRRFEVSLPLELNIVEVVGAELKPFFDGKLELNYHDMGYDGAVAVQAAMIELLQRLNGFGFDKAEIMGFGDKLKALGLAKKA